MAKQVHARAIKITQGDKSTKIWIHRIPDKTTGFWKAEESGRAFRDTGHHDQWASLTPFSCVNFYNDIGLRDTQGQGHTIAFSSGDSSSLVMTLCGMNARYLKLGDHGTGAMFFKFGSIIRQGPVTWEDTGGELVDRWQIDG